MGEQKKVDQSKCEKAADEDLEEEYSADENCMHSNTTSTTTTATTTTTPSPAKDEDCEKAMFEKAKPPKHDKVVFNSNTTAENNEEYTIESYLDFETRCACIKTPSSTTPTTTTTT